MFPSERSLNLMAQFGDSTGVTQIPQVVQRLTLSVMKHNQNSSDKDISFTVDLFPNALPDFLVHQAIFEEKWEKF